MAAFAKSVPAYARRIACMEVSLGTFRPSRGPCRCCGAALLGCELHRLIPAGQLLWEGWDGSPPTSVHTERHCSSTPARFDTLMSE